MKQKFALGLVAAIACAGAQAGVVFQDDFESYSGDVDPWSIWTNYDANDNRGIGLTSAANGGTQALETFLDLPDEGGGVVDKFVRATREFTVVDGGVYLLELFATNTSLGYEVFIDDVQVGTLQSAASYAQLSQALGSLSAGTHTLALGLYQDVGNAGTRYTASFDDIVIRSVDGGSVPEPQSLALVLAALAAGAFVRRRAR